MTLYEERRALSTLLSTTSLTGLKKGDQVWIKGYMGASAHVFTEGFNGNLVTIEHDQDLTDAHATFVGRCCSEIGEEIDFYRHQIVMIIRNGISIFEHKEAARKYSYWDMYSDVRASVREQLQEYGEIAKVYESLEETIPSESILRIISSGYIELHADVSVDKNDSTEICLDLSVMDEMGEWMAPILLANFRTPVENITELTLIAETFQKKFNKWVSDKWDYINRTGFVLVYYDGTKEMNRITYDGAESEVIQWADKIYPLNKDSVQLTASLIRKEDVVAIKMYPEM